MNDGGPAFPTETDDKDRDFCYTKMDTGGWAFKVVQHPGMSPRDWFAGTASPERYVADCCAHLDRIGLWEALDGPTWIPASDFEKLPLGVIFVRAVSRLKLQVADAMLAERDKATVSEKRD